MAFQNALNEFKDKKILVIGDFIADRSVIGRPTRISREAPVLILEHQSTEILPGGAANTINNIVELGAKVYAAGVIGDDEAGAALLEFFDAKGISTEGLIIHPKRPTVTKTRVWAGESGAVRQQIVRIDSGVSQTIDPEAAAGIGSFVRAKLDELDAIIFSDYGYGTLAGGLVDELIAAARAHGVITTADSRYDLLRFKGITVATPNKPESEAVTGGKLQTDADAEQMGEVICQLLQSEAVVITRGEDGMSVVEANGAVHHLPAFNKTEVYDVTGAGDTVIAVLTLGLASGLSYRDAALMANIAASIVIRKVGTAAARLDELTAAVSEFEEQEILRSR